ncbi:TIGR00341 family protein [Candidatus Uhrbacteria bacterium]|nr:TIGR00341 family protein [Candidatus Uhrbacteria bacterium]
MLSILGRLVSVFRKNSPGPRTASLSVFGGLTERGKAEAIERLVVESTPRGDFFALIVLAIMMATLGLFADSMEVVIGSMLIAPLLSPILSLAMGVVMADIRLAGRSLLTVLKAIVVAVPAAALAALFLYARRGGVGEMTEEMVMRTLPSLNSAGVALLAGAAASLALVKTHLSASLPGVAVSVSLLPPLAVTGIGLARWEWITVSRSFTLFLVNAGFIVLGGLIVFSLSRIYTKQKVAVRTVEVEDEKLEKGET